MAFVPNAHRAWIAAGAASFSLFANAQSAAAQRVEAPADTHLWSFEERAAYARAHPEDSLETSSRNAPSPAVHRFGFDLVIAFPSGAGVGANYTLAHCLTTTLALTTTGVWTSPRAEITLTFPAWAFSPSLTIAASALWISSVADGLVSSRATRILQDTAASLAMSGEWIVVGEALAGFDYRSIGRGCCGFHAYARAGIARQLGPTFGASGRQNEVTLAQGLGLSVAIGFGVVL